MFAQTVARKGRSVFRGHINNQLAHPMSHPTCYIPRHPTITPQTPMNKTERIFKIEQLIAALTDYLEEQPQ